MDESSHVVHDVLQEEFPGARFSGSRFFPSSLGTPGRRTDTDSGNALVQLPEVDISGTL